MHNGIMADMRVTGESLNMFNPTPHPFPGRGGKKRKMAGVKMKKTKFWIQLMVVGSKSCNFARFLENRQ